MTQEQIEELVWMCIMPADNSLTPCNSDRYNEGEVYSSCVKAVNVVISSPEYVQMKLDADNWNNYNEELKSMQNKLSLQ